MQCDESRHALHAYVDDELMPDEAEAIREHLASCGECPGEYQVLVHLSRRLRTGLERSLLPTS